MLEVTFSDIFPSFRDRCSLAAPTTTSLTQPFRFALASFQSGAHLDVVGNKLWEDHVELPFGYD